jgi:hypothetical protein
MFSMMTSVHELTLVDIKAQNTPLDEQQKKLMCKTYTALKSAATVARVMPETINGGLPRSHTSNHQWRLTQESYQQPSMAAYSRGERMGCQSDSDRPYQIRVITNQPRPVVLLPLLHRRGTKTRSLVLITSRNSCVAVLARSKQICSVINFFSGFFSSESSWLSIYRLVEGRQDR